jgi:hypothetical protein
MRAQPESCEWNAGTCHSAIAGGHLHVLRWLRTQTPPCPWDEDVCAAAAKDLGAGPELLVLMGVSEETVVELFRSLLTSAEEGGGEQDESEDEQSQDSESSAPLSELGGI